MASKPKSRVHAAMGGSKSKKSVHRIHVRRADSGGFIAENHFKQNPGEPPQDSEEHVLPNMDALKAHMDQNMGDQAEAEPPAAPAQAPQQVQA